MVQIEHNFAKFGQKLFSYCPDIYKIGMVIVKSGGRSEVLKMELNKTVAILILCMSFIFMYLCMKSRVNASLEW